MGVVVGWGLGGLDRQNTSCTSCRGWGVQRPRKEEGRPQRQRPVGRVKSD